LFQKIYPLLLILFIGVLTAQDASPADTEDQDNVESTEDQNVATDEAMPMEAAEEETKQEKENKPPKIQKPKTQIGSLLRGAVVPGLGHVYNDNKRIGYLWMGIEAALVAATMNFKSEYDSSLDDYKNYQTLYWEETDVALLLLYKEKRDDSRKLMDDANTSYQIFSVLLGVGWAYSAISAYLEGPGTPKYLERQRQAISKMDMNVAFNHEQQNMQLEFSIPLR
jgi:hypothetical protein